MTACLPKRPSSHYSAPAKWTSNDLRRLRLHRLIERIPRTHRYRLTDFGLRTALFFTPIYNRLLRPGLGRILPAFSKLSCPLRRAFDKLDQEVTTWGQQAQLSAA